MEGQEHAPSQPNWMDTFDERQQKEIDFARLYVAQYNHGSPGHMHLQVIAKLAALLDMRDGIAVEYVVQRNLVSRG